MKTTILTTMMLLSFILLKPASTFSQNKKTKDMRTLELKIGGMTCESGCAKGIENSVYKIKGVKKSQVNYDTQIATFIFDANKTSKEEIIKVVENFNPGEVAERKYSVTLINFKENEK